MIRLLPPVCRDCGKSADEIGLFVYLDFQLCRKCIAVREREVGVLDGQGARRRPKPARDRPASGAKKQPKTGPGKGRKRAAKKPIKPT